MNQDITFFAQTTFRNQQQVFGIKKNDRRQHIYIIGKTGVGKTALLKNMALQDIQKGGGVAIVDPHGEFIEEVLDSIPAHRINDVVYFNPADIEYPVTFNILEVPDPKYKHLVSSGLMGVFTKIWANVWSARMEYILNNCILALLDTPGTTLLGILRILVDRDYRQKIINNLQDPVVKSFWINEYQEWTPQYRNEAIAPIQNKVGQFLNVSLVRNIVGQSKSTINIPEIMDAGKIFLVDVSKGRVGEDNSALLGGIVITKIQLAAMERVRIPEEKRKDFFLYVDEFQNFVTESFANILSEARKYRLNLIIADQYIGQLITHASTKVRDAVFGNVGTLIIFRTGAADAEFLEKEFTPEFTALDLVNLPNFNIYLKLMIDGVTSRPFSAKTLPPTPSIETKSNREKIIEASRKKYSRSRKEVEEEIARWSGIMEMPTVVTPTPAAVGLYDIKCSLCGKWTKVPFSPEKGRAVYCKSCLKKAKTPIPPKKLERFEELEELGIEYKPSQTPPSPEKPKFFSEETEVKREVSPSISLEDLLKKEPTSFKEKKPSEDSEKEKAKRKEVKVKELKKALTEALEAERDIDKESKKRRAAEGPLRSRSEASEPRQRRGIIKPGETAEF